MPENILIPLEMHKIRVKICCISSQEEADMAIAHGASALGLVGEMPSGPGVISDALIAGITAKVPPGLSTFLLTSETKAEAIIDHHRRTLTNTIQLVDALEEERYDLLRKAMPAIKLVQVIHVRNESSIEEAIRLSEKVDALLLDSGNPDASVKELGGTGRTHNWKWSRKIVEGSSVPVFLAGGLKAENARYAVEEVNPYGLDLCSGVRTGGKLDPEKLEAFFSALRQ